MSKVYFPQTNVALDKSFFHGEICYRPMRGDIALSIYSDEAGAVSALHGAMLYARNTLSL